jgi:hypothetical protein
METNCELELPSYNYPDNTDVFTRGTIYQTLDPIEKVWSGDLLISKVCNSTKDWLWLMIQRKSIRIKK